MLKKEQAQSDEQAVRDALNEILDCLRKFDDDTRTRICRTVQTFFELDAVSGRH